MSVSGVVFKPFELLPRACSRSAAAVSMFPHQGAVSFPRFVLGLQRRRPSPHSGESAVSKAAIAGPWRLVRPRVHRSVSRVRAGNRRVDGGPAGQFAGLPADAKGGSCLLARPPFRGPFFQGLPGPAGVRGAGGIVSVQVGPLVISSCGAVTVVAASCTGSAIALTIASAVVAVVDPLVNAVTLARVNGVTCQCNGQSSGHSIGRCRVMLTQWSLD